MSEPHPTAPPSAGKPPKPEKPGHNFPLFPHATGRWAKKINGKLHYFGAWADPNAALAKYLEQKQALHSGRKHRDETGGAYTVKEVCNRFLNEKMHLVGF
jgi:hypothetical protein